MVRNRARCSKGPITCHDLGLIGRRALYGESMEDDDGMGFSLQATCHPLT